MHANEPLLHPFFGDLQCSRKERKYKIEREKKV